MNFDLHGDRYNFQNMNAKPTGPTGPAPGEVFTKLCEQAAKASVLEEAAAVVDGDREQTYGHPAKNFEATALIWSGILGIPVSVNQVALCMVGLKLARQSHQHKRDNLVDGAGYLRCIEKALDAGYDIMAPHGAEEAL